MLDGVHRNTSDLRPAVSLDLVLVVSVTSLEKRLVETTTSSNNTNHSTASGRNGLLGTRRELDSGLVVITVGDDGGVVTGSTSEHTTVSSLTLKVADDGTFRHLGDGKDVTDGKLGFVSAVDELSGVHALSSNEEFLLELVLVGMTERNTSQRSTSSRVVDDLSDNTLDVTLLLGVIEGSVLGSALAGSGDGLENATVTLTLTSDYSAHGWSEKKAPCTLR